MDGPLPEGIAEAFEEVCQNASDSTGFIFNEIFDSNLLFPLQRKRELEHMIRMTNSLTPRAPQTIMEIGTDKGGGAYHWLKALIPSRFIGIEIRGVPYGPVFDKYFPTRSLWLAKSSYDWETVEEVRTWLGSSQIDVLFIDGDKSRFDTDFSVYVPMVREGGLVFMHDIQDKAPREGYERSKEHPRVRETTTFVSNIEALEALENQLNLQPPKNAHEHWLRHWRGASCGVGVFWV